VVAVKIVENYLQKCFIKILFFFCISPLCLRVTFFGVFLIRSGGFSGFHDGSLDFFVYTTLAPFRGLE